MRLDWGSQGGTMNRRALLKSTAAIALGQYGHASLAAIAFVSNATAPSVPVSEKMMYATVRLEGRVKEGTKSGTAFFFSLLKSANQWIPALVTNRHVVDGLDECTFLMHSANVDGTPNLHNHIPITLEGLKDRYIAHSETDVDLVIIPMGDVIEDLNEKGRRLFFNSLDSSIVPSQAQLEQLKPLEEVVTIGYPGQVWDSTNDLPVFHHAFTASPPYLDFQGEKKFLIDTTTWPGASGSPVLLFNEGSWVDRRGNTNLGGTRVLLLGIVSSVVVQNVNGIVAFQAAPTLQGQLTEQIPANLGVCIKSGQLADFEKILIKRGIAPPPGYVPIP
jgi:hypothetical protein